LNENFEDILANGTIEAGPALKDEVKNNEYLDLSRLIMTFNCKSFGRLMELIRFINQNAG
jgi:hypothetical protein